MKHVVRVLIFVIASVVAVDDKLQCYQCKVRSNDLCTEEDLGPCPTDQAYDRCMTEIKKTKDEGFWIEKRCVLGPCSLRDPKQSTGLGLDHCDRTKPEFICVNCCKDNGCNTDGSAIVRPFNFYITAAISLILGIVYYKLMAQ